MMFHNGSMKDNINFKTLCPLKQKEQSAKITYQNGFYIYIWPHTGKQLMEEHRLYSLEEGLLRLASGSTCYHWEIYKLFFILHNVSPVWIKVENIMTGNLDKVFLL